MKNLLLILLALTGAQYSYAQPLNAEEMLQILQCPDYNCASKQIEAKGYDVLLNKETAGYKTYQFNSKLTYQNESNSSIARPYIVQYTIGSDDKNTTLSYTLGNKDQREALLANFEAMGFKYVRATKTDSNFDNNATEYTSDKHPGILLKVTNYEKRERRTIKYLEYEFQLWRAITDTTKAPAVVK